MLRVLAALGAVCCLTAAPAQGAADFNGFHSVLAFGQGTNNSATALAAFEAAGTVPAAALERPGWVVRLEPGADEARAEAEIARRGGGRLFVHLTSESLETEMRPIVYGMTALLLAIAGVNLLTTLLLGVRERRRERR